MDPYLIWLNLDMFILKSHESTLNIMNQTKYGKNDMYNVTVVVTAYLNIAHVALVLFCFSHDSFEVSQI